jgi:hypothetical protein
MLTPLSAAAIFPDLEQALRRRVRNASAAEKDFFNTISEEGTAGLDGSLGRSWLIPNLLIHGCCFLPGKFSTRFLRTDVSDLHQPPLTYNLPISLFIWATRSLS